MGTIGMAKVECLSCREGVKIKVIEYGSGYIAKCPQCGKLAYNSKEPPKEMKKL